MNPAKRPYRMRVVFPRSAPVEIDCSSIDQCLRVVRRVMDMSRARDGTEVLMKERRPTGRFATKILWYKSAGMWSREELGS